MEQMVMTIFCMLQIISLKNTKCKLKIVRALAPGVTTLPGSATPAASAHRTVQQSPSLRDKAIFSNCRK
jgi:hypothetical protein